MPKDRRMKAFGCRLRAARITAGYDDATDFATALGIEAARYRKYERGDSVPPLEVLEGIVRMTSHSLDWLLLGEPPPYRHT